MTFDASARLERQWGVLSERDRQTDRQTQRQRQRQTDRDRETQRQKQTDTQREIVS